MLQKSILILIFIVSGFSIFAQEGDPIIPIEREERPVILENNMDSALMERNISIEQPKKQQTLQLKPNAKFNTAFVPNENEGSELQRKEEDKKLSYNFLYYLFYKIRKVDNAGD